MRTCGLYARPSHLAARNFVKTILRLARTQPKLRVVNDQPLHPQLRAARRSRDCFPVGLRGKAGGAVGDLPRDQSRRDDLVRFCPRDCRLAGLEVPGEPITTAEFAAAARAPYSVLDTTAYINSAVQLCPTGKMPWSNTLRSWADGPGINLNMSSKVALVTGAGKRRVGNAVARLLATRGYAVALTIIARPTRPHGPSKSCGPGAEAAAFAADVADEQAVARLFDQVRQRFGRLDALVTAAAIWEPRSLEDTRGRPPPAVRHQHPRHLPMLPAGRAIHGLRSPTAAPSSPWATGPAGGPGIDYAAYYISKGSLPTMTRLLAVELGRRNPRVRVNCTPAGAGDGAGRRHAAGGRWRSWRAPPS